MRLWWVVDTKGRQCQWVSPILPSIVSEATPDLQNHSKHVFERFASKKVVVITQKCKETATPPRYPAPPLMFALFVQS